MIKKILQLLFNPSAQYCLKKLNIFIIYRDGNAIGDQVCMSGIIKLMYEQYNFKIIVFSNYPEIFEYNHRVWKNIGFNNLNKFVKLYILRFLRLFSGGQIENFMFQYCNDTLENYMRQTKKNIHLIQAHSMHFKNKVRYIDLHCEIYFSNTELNYFQKKFNLPDEFAIIQPIGKTTFTPNKEWGFGNFQQVITMMPKISWLQVGLSYDVLLKNVIDYRGKTNLRELFYLLSKARFVLANEGLLNHIVSSFNNKSIVVFSGFSCVGLAEYYNTISIYDGAYLECKPCWKLHACDIEGKPCMDKISVEGVVNTIKSITG